MDYNIAPLRISVPRSSGAPRTGSPGPCSQLRKPSLRIPAHHLLYPQGREILDAPPLDCLWWVQQRDAPVADPARLRCGAVSMLSMLLHSQQALARKRPQCLTAGAHSSALPALGTALDCVWLEGSLGADIQGSDRGIAHHWGPCPADSPVKQRCGPGVQESKPQQRARCACQPAPAPAAIAAIAAIATLTHSHRDDSREQRTRKWTAWRRARRSWEGSAAYRSMCLSRQNSGIVQCRALTGKLAQIHPSESSNGKLASASGGTCEDTWWWLEPLLEDVRLFVDDSTLPVVLQHRFLLCLGSRPSFLDSWIPGLSAGLKSLVSRGIGLCLLPETGFQNLGSKKQDHEQQSKPPGSRRLAGWWHHEVPELTDARQHHHLQHRGITTPSVLGGCTNRDAGEPGSRGGICGSAFFLFLDWLTYAHRRRAKIASDAAQPRNEAVL
ncbi:hypothetical protein BGZ57DRAFT_848260 [Hyaloscypha finlandica]|nr:hypothetical protein BGZ57DRAFT_848260 [Hyaloscypha finlandica]